MTAYRTGSHWGTTIIREGSQEPDESGRRPDDELVAVVMNGDAELAERIAWLLGLKGQFLSWANRIDRDVDWSQGETAGVVEELRRMAGEL